MIRPCILDRVARVAARPRRNAVTGELSRSCLSVHTPRYCTYEAAFAGKLAHPDFRAVRDGLIEQGRELAAARPDVIIINSCHLVTTFPTVVDGTPRHRGVLTAQEVPELIHGVEYDFPGDYDLAAALIDRGEAAGLQCVLANDIHYPLDYGTVMPMVCYLDRSQRLPVVPVSVCLSADLHESFAWGQHIARAVAATGRRAAFVASGSVSHKLVRGPERWPAPAEQELDRGFAGCWPTASTRSSGRGSPSTPRPPSRRWAAATSR
jgi:3,4-dihydroxyphenylacetate 2,3-dioxygenase